ncbi:MAG: glutamine--fructose-6-phosphate transaminase (isomerizing) [bacterium]|nr:glutamine--fructose-6-phosphate transaminase (isomerizing) [bacterium]
MCGIVGYIGKKQALPIIIKGLENLEYRGYDSVGILIYDENKKETYVEKSPGRIKDFIRIIKPDAEGSLGIGHSRWATHGEVNKENSHPHWDCAKKIFVVHNGIIENFETIKSLLIEKGHVFASETDTEVFPHLIEELMKEGLVYEDAVMKALRQVKGSFAFLIFNRDYPELMIASRFSSPLILGTGKEEFIVASDQTPIASLTKEVVYLNDGDVAFVKRDGFKLKSFLREGTKAENGIIDFVAAETEKGSFDDYMIKEIFEEAKAVENTLRGRLLLEQGTARLGGLEGILEKLKDIDNILICGCGTAFYAAKLSEYFFEEYAGIPTKADLASELRYRKPVMTQKTLLLAVSQSGETADTLSVVKEAKDRGILTLGIVNVVGSSIARMVTAGIYSHAGPELAVASTKAFLAQITDLILLMVLMARQRKMPQDLGKEILEELNEIPKKIEKIILDCAPTIEDLAAKCLSYKNFLYLGRKYSFPIALEGALKLKEISYAHAEGLAAGETKHGPIALIDENFLTVAIAPQDSVYVKTASNLEEIKARRGRIIAVTTEGNRKMERLAQDVVYVPKTLELLTPLLTIVPLHLFAYYFAKKLGRDVDRPRNLAKSVTVE